MGHTINGFIAGSDSLRNAAGSLRGAQVCPLDLGLAFLPLTDEFASLNHPASDYESLPLLTKPMVEWALAHSHESAIAYVETEYFGGMGSQSAIVWQNGTVQLGPITTDDFKAVTPLLDGAINRALRKLGVKRGSIHDEFDAVGLGSHRDNEDWIASAS